jgi:hypothetical protein
LSSGPRAFSAAGDGGHWANKARWLVVGLLGLAFALMLTSAITKSPTMDEGNHVARGAAFLGTGDPRLSLEHPPLVNTLSALPAHLLLDLQLPLDMWWEAAEWYHFADNFLWRANDNATQILFLARLPIMWLGLLLAALAFRWAYAMGGAGAGLLAMALVAIDPNLLAHARLSTTDLGGPFVVFLAAYAFWRYARSPGIGRLILSGIALGLAFAAKMSAALFGPLLGLALLADGLSGGPGRARRVLERLFALTAIAGLALLVVWGVYGFELGPVDPGGPDLPTPTYVRGVRAILNKSGSASPNYLWGEIKDTGWWYYFIVALLVKTPLPTLILWGLSWFRRPGRSALFLLFPAALYFLTTMTSSLNIGYRHLLPILPLLAVYAGQVATAKWRVPVPLTRIPHPASRIPNYVSRFTFYVLLLFLITWLALNTLFIHPHFLAFFNVIGGGPEEGWRVLVDSNIDWGQDLKGLKAYLDTHQIERVNLAWFGSAYPERYGISFDPLPGVGFPSHFELWSDPPFDRHHPEPGVYAISVTNLVGAVLPDHEIYAWFRERTPVAKVGYSVFIYQVPE